jgi:hypothetical protein
VKTRWLTTARAQQLVTDFEQVTIRDLAIDLRRAVNLALELGIYAYDAYILEAAQSSGFRLLALDCSNAMLGDVAGQPIRPLRIESWCHPGCVLNPQYRWLPVR